MGCVWDWDGDEDEDVMVIVVGNVDVLVLCEGVSEEKGEYVCLVFFVGVMVIGDLVKLMFGLKGMDKIL